MKTTMINFSPYKFFIAISTSELLKTSKHLPENVLPSDLLLSQKHDKFINIPVFIVLMFSDNVSVEINKNVSFWTVHPFSLHVGIQRITVDTSMEHVVFLLKKKL